ncbi:hypothetical protein NP590_03235 [Methylomonas sp. SURF-2]|uniref:Transglutaminase-like domain-containing protein n=1 Tax=Methylomonas subterranea TaxID=2952225 RepID=A0ABT1TCX5_9GAMM|nr:hypothetical protein [Methylomonas sp. SURF-2]MCQ8103111.1 hypothetical protein [Methylomonas sp. SURF-2]
MDTSIPLVRYLKTTNFNPHQISEKSKMIGYIILALSSIFFILSIYLKYSQYVDEKSLDRFLSTVDLTGLSKGKIIERLNQAVYFNKGFAKNKQYFLFQKLGPTPVQVLQNGGDCADKSRLLSALLKRLNIDSTLVMLYGSETSGPTHTIVNARYEKGWMAADPVFNISFPRDDDTYYGVSDLKADSEILINRLDFLEKLRGKDDKIAFYKRETESYNWPKTINWDKNPYLRKIANILENLKVDPYLLKRPQVLENPKNLIGYISFLTALLLLTINNLIA